MGTEKSVVDLIVDEDNNEREIEVKEANLVDCNDFATPLAKEINNVDDESNNTVAASTIIKEDTLSNEAFFDRNTLAQSIRDQVKENQSHVADKMCKKHD